MSGFTLNKGFTLLELLVVIFLVTLTLGIVATNFSSANSSAELKTETRKLVTLLRHARTQSMSKSITAGIIAADQPSTYQLIPSNQNLILPDGINITIAPLDHIFESTKGVYFYPDGSSNGGAIQLTTDTNLSEITINGLTGEVAVETP